MFRGPWTLRRRLVLGVAAVVATVLVVVGTVLVMALRGTLTTVVDSQLSGSMSAFTHSVTKFRPADGEPAPFKPLTEFVGQSPGSVIVLLRSGAVVDSADFSDAEAAPLPPATVDQVQNRTWTPGTETVDLDGLGSYRLLIRQGPADRTLIAGAPLDTVDAAVLRQTAIIAILAVLALALTVAGVIAVVRFALGPLARVARTAAEVAALPLGRGDVAITARVDDADTDPRTEVGRVGYTLNTLISHVDDALSVRADADRRMRQFITDASHELRTPLAAIQGYAELTRQDSSTLPATTEYSLARIEAEATRMSSLVADLLFLARLDEGHDAATAELDLANVLFNAVNDARASAPSHRWIVEVPPSSVIVDGDEERLHQLLANLLSNARVHTPPGTTVTSALDVANAQAVLTITDDGPGIDPSLVPELFERFVRGDKARSRQHGHAGLGLAIASSIVDTFGGSIGVDSQPGRTQFRVTVPLPPAADAFRHEFSAAVVPDSAHGSNG